MTDQERFSLMTLVQHPSVILVGFPLVGVIRVVETVLQIQENQVSDDLKGKLLQGDHPDFIIRDGRDLKLEELRELVQDVTVLPALWSKRYLVIFNLDHAYHSSYSTLLRLIEEPPAHLSVVISVNSTQKVTDTIRSRSLVFPVRGMNHSELVWWLNFKHKVGHQDLRIRASGGDPEIAELMDAVIVKEWLECWESFTTGGGELSTGFLTTWDVRFEVTDNLTQLACWHLLGTLLSKKLVQHPLWLAMGSLALQARNTVRAGKINKQQSSMFLIKLYALARTVKNRTKTKV